MAYDIIIQTRIITHNLQESVYDFTKIYQKL